MRHFHTCTLQFDDISIHSGEFLQYLFADLAGPFDQAGSIRVIDSDWAWERDTAAVIKGLVGRSAEDFRIETGQAEVESNRDPTFMRLPNHLANPSILGLNHRITGDWS